MLLSTILLNFVFLSISTDPTQYTPSHSGILNHECIHDRLLKIKSHHKIPEATFHDNLPLKQVPTDTPKRSIHQSNTNQKDHHDPPDTPKRSIHQSNSIQKDHHDPPDTPKRSIHQSNSILLKPHHDPIRIHIAVETLLNDPYTCYEIGQTIQALDSTMTDFLEYQCGPEDVLTFTKLDYLVNRLLDSSVVFLESALKVVRSMNNLTLGLAECSISLIPVAIPEIYNEGGVDADFIIFPTARPILGGSTLAFAGTCATSSTIHRPVAGHANFNVSGLVPIANDFPRQQGIVIHELTHALGFSSDRYYDYIAYTGYDPTHNVWLYRSLAYSEVIKTNNVGGHIWDTVVTPTVVSTVRLHFGCSDAVGADLEDGGGGGTSVSHWEKRIYMNEYMTASDSNNPILSNITLSLFVDTGWYEVDFTVGEPLLWGRHLGCEFLQDCGQWTHIPNIPMGFCDDGTPQDQVMCTFDRTGYGMCNIVTDLSPPLPVYYRHYDNANPTVGGQNELADYCGYFGQRGNAVYCNLGGTDIVQVGDDMDTVTDTGEQFELNSRCMFSTLSKPKSVPISTDSFSTILPGGQRAARCYNTSCVDKDDVRVQVDGVWYPCNEGQIKVIGYGGYLECPEPSEICGGVRRDITWPRLIKINPKQGPPSSLITITGDNFSPQFSYTVIMEYPCTNVQLINSHTILATVPSVEEYSSFINLYFFRATKSVVVMDSRGYTAQRDGAFVILVDLDVQYLTSLSHWMVDNPLWGFLTWVCSFVGIIVCFFGFRKILRQAKRLPGDARIARTESFRDTDFLDPEYNHIESRPEDETNPEDIEMSDYDYEIYQG